MQHNIAKTNMPTDIILLILLLCDVWDGTKNPCPGHRTTSHIIKPSALQSSLQWQLIGAKAVDTGVSGGKDIRAISATKLQKLFETITK